MVFYRGDSKQTATVELGKRPSSLQQPAEPGDILPLP